MQLESYILGKWCRGEGAPSLLRDATTGEVVAELTSIRLDGRAVLAYSRTVGGRALRELTFHQRAALLKSLAKYLSERKQELYSLSFATGATRPDSMLDIEGGLGVLFSYASRALRELPDDRVLVEGGAESLSKGGEFVGQHVCVSRNGSAVQINAYNFPVWGMLEKTAPAILAGMPVVVKPASATAFVTELLCRLIIESAILPEGAVQLICGSSGDLLEHVTCQDSVAFTGSAATAMRLRGQSSILSSGARFTAETDSLNSCLLGPDAAPGTPEFDLFVQEIGREMTLKAGQRCTAIRKAIVPEKYLHAVADSLRSTFAAITYGDPRREDVAMGPLVSLDQRRDVSAKVAALTGEAEFLTGDKPRISPLGADAEQGAFVAPTLLLCRRPHQARAIHSVEAFGPVCTLMPYDSPQDAVALAALGGGSLVSSVFTADEACARDFIAGLAPLHGRVLSVDRTTGAYSTGHGSPLPGLIHGGPGRAGGGEELGGIRAVLHHMQRTAVQTSPAVLAPWRRELVR